MALERGIAVSEIPSLMPTVTAKQQLNLLKFSTKWLSPPIPKWSCLQPNNAVIAVTFAPELLPTEAFLLRAIPYSWWNSKCRMMGSQDSMGIWALSGSLTPKFRVRCSMGMQRVRVGLLDVVNWMPLRFSPLEAISLSQRIIHGKGKGINMVEEDVQIISNVLFPHQFKLLLYSTSGRQRSILWLFPRTSISLPAWQMLRLLPGMRSKEVKSTSRPNPDTCQITLMVLFWLGEGGRQSWLSDFWFGFKVEFLFSFSYRLRRVMDVLGRAVEACTWMYVLYLQPPYRLVNWTKCVSWLFWDMRFRWDLHSRGGNLSLSLYYKTHFNTRFWLWNLAGVWALTMMHVNTVQFLVSHERQIENIR